MFNSKNTNAQESKDFMFNFFKNEENKMNINEKEFGPKAKQNNDQNNTNIKNNRNNSKIFDYTNEDINLSLMLINKLTPKKKAGLHSIVYLYKKYGNVFASNKKLAKNSGCCEKTIRELKKECEEVIFKKRKRLDKKGRNTTEEIIFLRDFGEIFIELIRITKHLRNFSLYEKNINKQVYYKFKDIRDIGVKCEQFMNKKRSKTTAPKSPKTTAHYIKSSHIHSFRNSTKQNSTSQKEKEKDYITFNTSSMTSLGISSSRQRHLINNISPKALYLSVLDYKSYNKPIRHTDAFFTSIAFTKQSKLNISNYFN